MANPNENDRCYTCDGAGEWCGLHASPDGCDCEETVEMIPCADCGGTGLANDEDEDETEAVR